MVEEALEKAAAEILVEVCQLPLSLPTKPFEEWLIRALIQVFFEGEARILIEREANQALREGLVAQFAPQVSKYGLLEIMGALKADQRLTWVHDSARMSRIREYSKFTVGTMAAGQWEIWLTKRDLVGERIEKIFGPDLSENLKKKLRQLFEI